MVASLRLLTGNNYFLILLRVPLRRTRSYGLIPFIRPDVENDVDICLAEAKIIVQLRAEKFK
ncbi:MAG TPA: hypothetical protein VMW76_05710 [Bacteroidales bacterium]|nr:hypothetical protein [Bacteroidales bacterium]